MLARADQLRRHVRRSQGHEPWGSVFNTYTDWEEETTRLLQAVDERYALIFKSNEGLALDPEEAHNLDVDDWDQLEPVMDKRIHRLRQLIENWALSTEGCKRIFVSDLITSADALIQHATATPEDPSLVALTLKWTTPSEAPPGT